MSQSLDVNYLKPFIESTIDAAARFRRVLIIMVTVSILALGALWNSLDETWFNARIAAARKGEAYLTLEDMRDRLTRAEKDLSDLEAAEQREPDEKKKEELEEKKKESRKNYEQLLAGAKKILNARFDQNLEVTEARVLGEELQRKNYENVRHWLKQRMMIDKEQAAQYAQKLEEARTANILLIHIPLSGGVFDVNSLSLAAGITFVVILLVFRFSLWREYNNLRLTFKEARPEHLRYSYRALGMQQVLTVPPALSQSQPHLKPKGRVIQLLYLPPALIQLAIIINDFRTEDIGEIFSSYLALGSLALSILLLFFILVLTVRCLQLSSGIDEEWDAAAKKIQEWEAAAEKIHGPST